MNKDKNILLISDKRYTIAENLRKKIHAVIILTDEESDVLDTALTDPLWEFCMREGAFRLNDKDIFNLDVETSNKYADEAAKSIKDTIDTSEALYDEIDAHLREDVVDAIEIEDN